MNSEKMVKQWGDKLESDVSRDLKVAAMWRRTDFIIELGEPMDTWRFRLANFISGGAWARDRKRVLEIIEQDRDVKAELRVNLIQADKAQQTWEKFADEATLNAQAAEQVLHDIIAMETPKCAHIGKRMAEAARKGLGA